MSKILIGSHVSMAKPDYLLGSVNEALSYGANTFMIYTGAPQNSLRTPISQLKLNEFWDALKQNDIDIGNVIVHAPYIMNIGTNDKIKAHISTTILNNEVNRTCAIKAKYLIIHPGNATNTTKEQAIKNIASSINEINKKNKDVCICLETMSGKGSEIGSTFNEIKQIIDLIQNKHLIGVCLDTCHINDAGYDVGQIDSILNEFEKEIGLKYLKVIHLNDSKNIKGARKDRHENIGYGTIGFNNLVKWVYHSKLTHIPKILETPWRNNHPIYKQEIEMLKTKKWNNL